LASPASDFARQLIFFSLDLRDLAFYLRSIRRIIAFRDKTKETIDDSGRRDLYFEVEVS